jgi:hypothetical protein
MSEDGPGSSRVAAKLAVSQEGLSFMSERVSNTSWMQTEMDIQAYLSRLMQNIDRTIAEAVSRGLSTAAARVRARFFQVGFVVDKVASG